MGHLYAPVDNRFRSVLEELKGLAPREADLTRLNERLKELDCARTQFFSNLSREFRTPLTLLLGPLQDLLDSPASALAPEARAVLEMARRNAVRLLKLVDTLFELSRIEGARDDGAGQATDLASFTAELAGNFRSACEWAGLNLIVDCPPTAGPVCVNSDVWEKIVLNLIANAFKSTAEGTIEVSLRVQDGKAGLTVRDTGRGIPESELPHLFTQLPWVGRIDAGTSGLAGVGLALVHELVQLCNGSIQVESKPGRGSTFTVLLPLATWDTPAPISGEACVVSAQTSGGLEGGAAASREPRTARDGEASNGAYLASSTSIPSIHGRVVVADDNADMRDYLCHVLEADGFEVNAVPNGAAALAACRLQAPDAVISDVLMPGLDGFELIEHLRADEHTALIPVLLLSGRAGEDSRIAGLAAGADDYLVKPLSRRELVARVEGAVRLARLRREAAHRQQADLESLFAMTPDGVIVVGRDGRVLTANERAQELFDYSLQELQRLHIDALMPEDQWAACIAQTGCYAGSAGTIQELRGARRDGSELVAEIRLGPIQFRNQSCAIAVVRDITARKKLENERAEQEERFRNLSRRLVDVQETERRMLSTELHDRTSPHLAAIRINLKMLEDVLRAQGTDDVRALLEDTIALVAETTVGIREISSDLRPTVLDDGGLFPAVKGYAQQFMRRTGIAVHVEAKASAIPLTPPVQSSLFRIVQEALTNCAKHAKARHVTIRLSTEGDRIALAVADDGVGFDAGNQTTTGLGLHTMRERAEFAGGRFSLETKPGQGTRVQVLI